MRLANGRMTRTAGAVLAGVMALSLAGCGGSAPVQESSAPKQETQAQTEAQAAAGEPEELTIWMGSWWEDQIPKIVEAYKAVEPNVNLTIEALPVNGYVDKAVTTILGGGGPDILAVDVTQMGTLVDKNLLQPWDDQIKDMDLSDFAAVIEGGKFDGVYWH